MKFKTLVLATVIGAIAVSGCGILKGKPAKVEPTEQSVLNYCKNNIKGFEEVKPTLGILSSEDPYNVELYECYNDCNLSGDVLDWGSLSIVAGLKTKGALISTITPPLIEEILDKKGNTFIYGHPANGNPLSSYHYLHDSSLVLRNFQYSVRWKLTGIRLPVLWLPLPTFLP